MACQEQAERIGGAAFLGVPAFEAFVSILDNYARMELLVKLHDYLPSFMINPVTSFACLCIGLWLLHLSHQKQLKRVNASRLLDSTGAEYKKNEKAKWLIPVLVVFLIALIATPILAVGYSLAYKGEPPKPLIPPSPPYSAYQKTPSSVPLAKPPSARGQQQSGKDNVQTGPITQGPGSALSFNQQGGVTAGTINIGTQWPFNSDIQMAMIAELSQTSGRVRLGWPSYDPDGLKFAGGLLYAFEKAGWKQEPQKVTGTYVGSICYPSETWDCHGIRIQFRDPSSAMAKTVIAAFKRINVYLDVGQASDLDDDLVDVLISKP